MYKYMRIQGREDSYITKYPKGIFALLDKYGKPYDVVYTNFVGTIVYEDEWQAAVREQDGKMV